MKAQILKIAGVKSEAAFYKKFPSQEAFMKVHSKEFKKAQTKNAIEKAQRGKQYPNQNWETPTVDEISASTMAAGIPQSQPYGMDQYVQQNNQLVTGQPIEKNNNKGLGISGQQAGSMANGLFGAINAYEGEKNKVKKDKQNKAQLDLYERLTLSPDVNVPLQKHVWSHPEDSIASTNYFNPSKGTGYNILSAQDGNYIPRGPEGFVQGMGVNQPGYDYEYITDENQGPLKSEVVVKPVDNKSARDIWVQKTGLPWSDAKKLGYTSGSAKDNIHLLDKLNKDIINKDNIKKQSVRSTTSRTSSSNLSSSNTVSKTNPRSTDISPEDKVLYEKFFGKKNKKSTGPVLSASKEDQLQREKYYKRTQAEHDDYLLGELPLYYLAHPSKLIGDVKNYFNPGGTREDETSKGFRKEVMANRYNPNQTNQQRVLNHLKKGVKLTPKAALNLSTVLSGTPYTTIEQMPIGIGEGAAQNMGSRAAGYLGQGATRIGAGAVKQLTGAAAKQIGPGFVPNFGMYKDGGEISNTFAPNTLYDDLDQVKQYADGGLFGGNYGQLNAGVQNVFGNNAGSQVANFIPGPVGTAAGMIFGMADNMFGPAGEDKSLQRTNTNTSNRILGNTMYQNLGFHGSRKDGGYVSNDWTPQVITKFGDHTAQDYYNYAHEYDRLRSGGHLKDAEYTPINQRGLETMAQGGEFQTHWGGNLAGGEGVKPVSFNPFSKGQGLTYNAYGQSHNKKDGQGRTGIGISVLGEGGQANDEATVEMENNEPIIKMADGGDINDEGNAVIFGNLTTNEEGLKHFGLDHKKYSGKFKNIINKIIVPEEQKINKQMDNLFKNKDNSTLAEKTKQIKNDAYLARLAQLAKDKESLADYQDGIHQAVKLASKSMGKNLSTENFAKGLYTTKLAKGELPADNLNDDEEENADTQEEYTPISRNGRIAKAQSGKKTSIYDIKSTEALENYRKGQHHGNKYYGEVDDKAFETLKNNNPWFDWSDFDPTNPNDVTKFQNQFNVASELIGSNARINVDGELGEQTASAKVNLKSSDVPKVSQEVNKITNETPENPFPVKEKFNYMPLLNAGLNIFKKPYNMPLSPEEYRSELYALATNQPKGVYGPHVHSMLETPMKENFDPTRHAIESQARAAQRYSGNNPAAQAAIFGQVADKLAGINAQELAANQELYSKIANNNIATVNKDMYANAATDYDVADKLVKADDNTRKETINAMSSLDDKILENKKANREMNIASAMFPDYTFNNEGVLIKNPRFIDFDTSGKTAVASNKDKYIQAAALKAYQDKLDKKAIKEKADEEEEATTSTGRNGKKLSLKNKMNGSIVKAYKNF